MAGSNKPQPLIGIVQKFPDKELVSEREVNNQTVREFTVKSVVTGKLVRISLWPEYDEVEIQKGASIVAEGKINVTTGRNGQEFYGLTPYSITVTQPVPKKEREVVNKSSDDENEVVF